MKTLIIPDIHDRIERVDEILRRETPNHVVSLGDWFDSWTGSEPEVQRTAEYLRDHTEGWTLLLGNHDLSYGWLNHCSGWSQEKQRVIDRILTRKDWDRFFPYTWVGPYLCTHAGVHKTWWKDDQDFMNQMHDLEYNLRESKLQRSFWLGAGRDRGGDQRVGGIVWCDWSSLNPPDGVKQICGHTPASQVRFKNGGDVICLDTALKDYAIWDGEKLEVKHF